MRLLSLLIGSFFGGGVIGAYGFQQIGYLATVPLAAILLLFAFAPVLDDLVRARVRV